MSLALLALVATALIGAAFLAGRGRARVTQGSERLHSLPEYHGWYAALCAGIPALICIVLWLLITPLVIEPLVLGAIPAGSSGAQPDLFLKDVRNLLDSATPMAASEATRAAADLYARYQSGAFLLALAAAVALGSAGLSLGLRRIKPRFPARVVVERSVQGVLLLCSTVAVLITAGIIFSLLFETLRFFDRVSPIEFLFGLHWSPQTALRADQVGSSGSFGAIPLFAGTLLVTGIAIGVAAPIGLLSAIYMTFYASARTRRMLKPALEMLAGVPTVVYGFFAALIIAPTLRQWGSLIGLDVASESALAAGLVMGVMIIPFISSLSDDAIVAVPSALRDGSYGLGATRSETIRQVIIPAALPGIVGAFLLAISRAIGETMIVVMAAGLAANLTANPLAAVTTVTVQIVTLLTGDQEFDSAKTLAAFALGLALFAITLLLNAFALRIVQKYRERYD
jgi:phosphate transport system permease protein